MKNVGTKSYIVYGIKHANELANYNYLNTLAVERPLHLKFINRYLFDIVVKLQTMKLQFVTRIIVRRHSSLHQ